MYMYMVIGYMQCFLSSVNFIIYCIDSKVFIRLLSVMTLF